MSYLVNKWLNVFPKRWGPVQSRLLAGHVTSLNYEMRWCKNGLFRSGSDVWIVLADVPYCFITQSHVPDITQMSLTINTIAHCDNIYFGKSAGGRTFFCHNLFEMSFFWQCLTSFFSIQRNVLHYMFLLHFLLYLSSSVCSYITGTQLY